MELDKFIRDNFACPVCKYGGLKFLPNALLCDNCHHLYNIKIYDGKEIINFIPDFKSPFTNPAQKLWEYLLEQSSVIEEKLLRGLMDFDNAGKQYCRFNFSNLKILDVGGGSGEMRRYLNGREKVYVCLDPDPRAYKNRKILGNLDSKLNNDFNFVLGVAEYLPFKSETFDFLIMNGMIEHVFNINFAFSEAYRVLKKGGKFFIGADFHGANIKNIKISPVIKVKTFFLNQGFSATFKRIMGRIVFNLRRRLSPWKEIFDFTQPQVENGHIYDDLKIDDIKKLGGEFGFKTSYEIENQTSLIFTKH